MTTCTARSIAPRARSPVASATTAWGARRGSTRPPCPLRNCHRSRTRS
ncbi:hypothetical protein ALQ80_03520 [Pseudomonas coronafaciens pv. oryzae]|nr:hypothetical protein ALQ80_03520 [Pseudomonas coronafaciens pv. oryzae]